SELAAALRTCRNLVLSSELTLSDSAWEDPLPQFRAAARAVGHVHVWPGHDAVVRNIALAKAAGHDRRWAISLEALRLSRGVDIVETYGQPDLQVGETRVPAEGDARVIRLRFPPPDRKLREISLRKLLADPTLAAQFTDKVVFAGVTAQTEHDRLFSPYSKGIPTSGIEINADAFETLAHGQFIRDVPDSLVLLFAALLVAAA